MITSDDIERSTATSLPEVLRLAPNLQVQQVNATQYAISARGFNGIESSNKLLVLMDGRNVYSTLHSGVFWELHAPLLEDIQQIEVISGPGGTLYGPNTVNGVISVASKDASDTLGALARATGGAQERTAAARYGFKLGDTAAMRVYADYFDREDEPTGLAPAADQAIRGWQTGFRTDASSDAGHLTLQGDVFDNRTFLVAGDGNHGHDLLTRWTCDLTPASSLQFQAYYDYFQRRTLLTVDTLETMDVEGQYNLKAGAHNLVAGLGMRTTHDRFVNTLNAFQLDPQHARLWIGNGFVQDRVTLSPEVSVIAGVKLEGSTFTGLQVLPNLRLAWEPSAKALLWASASRAVRTPSRIDRDLTEPTFLAKAPAFMSEKLVAFEGGYRGQPGRSTSLSVSLFYNLYTDIRSADFIGPPGILFPLQLMNDTRGHTYGLEAWGTRQLTPWWRMSAGMALLHKDFHVRPGALDLTDGAALGHDPDHQAMLRSQMTLPHGVTLDGGLRLVGPIENPHINGYAEADARLGWNLNDRIELYLTGDNLLHATHAESNDPQRAEMIERTVSVGARLRL